MVETAGVGDSVTCAGLVSGVDERSPIVCVGGTDGRKVVFVDVLSGEALSEIAVGSQSMSSSSAAAIGSSLLGKFGISLGAREDHAASSARIAQTDRVRWVDGDSDSHRGWGGDVRYFVDSEYEGGVWLKLAKQTDAYCFE